MAVQSFLDFIPRNPFRVFKGGEIQKCEHLECCTNTTFFSFRLNNFDEYNVSSQATAWVKK